MTDFYNWKTHVLASKDCEFVKLGTHRFFFFSKDTAVFLHLRSRIWKHQSQIVGLYFSIAVDGILSCLSFFSLFVSIFLFIFVLLLQSYFSSFSHNRTKTTVCFYVVLGQSKRKRDCRASLFKEIRQVLGRRWWESSREEKH